MKWACSALAGVLLGLHALPTNAALEEKYYRRAREQARHHLQLRVDKVELLPGRQLDNCVVEATVLRDFRGDMPAGAPLRFGLNCQAPGVRPMPGPDAWHEYERLRQAKFAEGFFRGISPRTGPVYGQLGLVVAERDSPWCEAESGLCDRPPPS